MHIHFAVIHYNPCGPIVLLNIGDEKVFTPCMFLFRISLLFCTYIHIYISYKQVLTRNLILSVQSN